MGLGKKCSVLAPWLFGFENAAAPAACDARSAPACRVHGYMYTHALTKTIVPRAVVIGYIMYPYGRLLRIIEGLM